ncbi:SsgA family sporulation/cell division regulator [Streptomyces sp. HNM0575]|uniref:SsgA family sporulation/cell division regulator n=1 Tax=Streptomyces sp. HNM0575 TaxID=2716338 RepID=UPI00145F7B67|nr:SsgA family sporulation/cell division regulator [Streptomyces sp. HNM0575]NLU75257.1 SsgA family sporulation/cell division regulator [Streptomyces sp. HNM0575]
MNTTVDDGDGGSGGDVERPGKACVIRDLEVFLVLSAECAAPLRARFTYRATDPFAVQLDFHLATQSPVRWIISRELLTTGMVRPVGRGDVRVWPTHGDTQINLRLYSPDGDAVLETAAGPLAEWLERTCLLVPPGHEERFLDTDTLIKDLLRESP